MHVNNPGAAKNLASILAVPARWCYLYPLGRAFLTQIASVSLTPEDSSIFLIVVTKRVTRMRMIALAIGGG